MLDKTDLTNEQVAAGHKKLIKDTIRAYETYRDLLAETHAAVMEGKEVELPKEPVSEDEELTIIWLPGVELWNRCSSR